MNDDFNMNEPLSLKMTENFGDNQENTLTNKMIRELFNKYKRYLAISISI